MCMCKIELCAEHLLIPTTNFECHQRLCDVAARSEQATGAASIVAAGIFCKTQTSILQQCTELTQTGSGQPS